jgi:hypothetical protein
LFTGFRSWWQDNITNNQKLKQGLGMMEDRDDAPKSYGPDPKDGLIFRDANG